MTHAPGLNTFFGEMANPTPGPPDPTGAPAKARARFLAALGTTQTSSSPFNLDFENQTTGATTVTTAVSNYFSTTSGSGINASVGGGTALTITGMTVAGSNTSGRFNTSGNGSGRYLACTAGTDVVFTFDYGVSAFGFYATDVRDAEGALSLAMLPDDGGPEDTVVVKSTADADGNLLFFGFTTTTKRYTRIRVICATPVDIYGIDDVVCACQLMVLNPNPNKAFGVTLSNYGNQAGTTYTASVVTTSGTYNFTLPVTAAGGRAFWGLRCNGGHKLLSVALTTSNTADAPTYDDVVMGSPIYS